MVSKQELALPNVFSFEKALGISRGVLPITPEDGLNIHQMISNTNSFKRLKDQVQEVIDFSVLCCTAVPAMKGYIKAVEKGSALKIPDPDYYKGDPNYDQLKGYVPNYRKNLGKLLFLSSFSYFEAYFKSMIEEFFEFHGGFDAIIEVAHERQQRHIQYAKNEPARASVRKLREYPKPGKEQKYEKHTRELLDSDYRFPSELVSPFGLKELHSRYREMKSVEIPYFAKWCFGVQLTEDEIESYHSMRDIRNELAHGKREHIDLRESLGFNKALREIAKKIDQHVTEHFFVIESTPNQTHGADS